MRKLIADIAMLLSGFFGRPGKTSGLLPRWPICSLRRRNAASPSGTLKASPIFIRSFGMTHVSV